MVTASLQHIKNFLEHENFECELFKKTDDLPFDHLCIHFDTDKNDRSYILQMKLDEQSESYSKNSTSDSSEAQEITLSFLQLMLSLPFEVKAEQSSDVARLLFLINQGLELPGFEFSEVNQMIYFRYTLSSYTKKFHKVQLMTILGMILYSLDSFSEMIEEVAIGERSLEKTVKELIEA